MKQYGFLKQSFRGQNHWWRYAIILSVFLTPILSDFIKSFIVKPLSSFFEDDFSMQFAIKQIRYVILVVLFLVLFSFLHKRSYKTLLTSRRKFDFLRFWLSFSAWGVLLMFVFSIKVMLNPNDYEWNFKLIPFLKLSLLSILLLPLRVFFMTIFTNSYILQLLTRVFKKPIISLIASVILFTLLMYINNKSLIDTSGYQFIFYYLMLSLMICLIIVLDGGVEIISGVFLVSTLISRLFIAYNTDKAQLGVVFVKEGGRDVTLFAYVIPFICCPLFFIFLFKLYKWKDWREKLFKQISI